MPTTKPRKGSLSAMDRRAKSKPITAAHGSLKMVNGKCDCEKCSRVRAIIKAQQRGDGVAQLSLIARQQVAPKRRVHAMDALMKSWKRLGVKAACVICGDEAIQRNHVFPIAKNGSDDVFNIRPLCVTHNRMKGTLHPEVFFKTLIGSTATNSWVKEAAGKALRDYQTNIKPRLTKSGIDVSISTHEWRKAKRLLSPAA